MISVDLANTISDPRAYADGDKVDAAFKAIRATAPLEKAQPEGYDPFWVDCVEKPGAETGAGASMRPR